ncbi:MAG: threonine--tRNA ligase [Candidatus Latescibacterota bacterium]
MAITVTFPDGSTREYVRGVTVGEVAEDVGPRLAKAAVAGMVDGRIVGLSGSVDKDAGLQILTFSDPQGRGLVWHSCAHVLAQAVKELFPEAKLGIGPAIAEGFYYDFDVAEPFSPGDLERIERRVRQIVKEDVPFVREEVSRAEARCRMEAEGEAYKLELLDELGEDEKITLYRSGGLLDLCRGPHLPSTGRIKVVKLLSVAGAYWRGDEKRKMLQRIYGIAFESDQDLRDHVEKLAEIELRDHRRLGRELDLFSLHEEGGPGLVFWHPKGARIRTIIEDFWREEHVRRGYDIVYTPHVAKAALWETSGHLSWFRDDMYPPMDVDGTEYLVRPMNCPFHIMMYKTQMRSYRELPMRWGELGTVYRYERSGVLQGMLRVRGFTQDDAHIFCRPDQLEAEIAGVIDLALFMLSTFGYCEYIVELSVRDPEKKDRYIGADAVWEQAETALKNALEVSGLTYKRAEGEAKFYGPAIDIQMKDALGRGWQGPTIQVDFNEPERFDVNYVGGDGETHRVVMVHRTVLGSMERFVGGLIEHYAGAFPVWLAPVQAMVIPISDDQLDYALELADRLRAQKIRVSVDERREKMGYKIREAEQQKIPYMLIVGAREMDRGMVAVRRRSEGDLGEMSVESLLDRISTEVGLRSLNE